MDEVLRAQLRRFLAEQTEEQLAALVNASLRSGQGAIDFYDPLTRYTLELGATNREDAQTGSLYPVLLPSALSNISALYQFLKGNTHPWKQCKIFQIQTSKLQEAGAVFDIGGSDDDGGRNLLVEFFTFIRALEPFPLRPYSKMLMVHLAERAVWADRNGWEEHEHPEIFTRVTKALETAPYKTAQVRLRTVLATLAAFRSGLEQVDLSDEELSAWMETNEEFYYQVVNGQMSEVYHVIDIIEAAGAYLINSDQSPSSDTSPAGNIRVVADTMKETGLHSWCDSTVSDLESWVERKLMPRIIIDAASSLNA